MLFHFLQSRYIIECTIGSLILFRLPANYLSSKNYFVVNAFTKIFRNLGFLHLVEQEFFCVFNKIFPLKYVWVLIKHVSNEMDTLFLFCSSDDMVWNKRNFLMVASHCQRRLYSIKENFLGYIWTNIMMITLHMVTYWLELEIDNWIFTSVPISDILCMELGLYMNQLICIVKNNVNFKMGNVDSKGEI